MSSPPHRSLAWIDGELEDLERTGLRRRSITRLSGQGPAIIVDDGSHDHVELINFGSNDYLSLADDSRLLDAARAAADCDGWGAGASPLVTGRSGAHARLEHVLHEFMGVEAALVFPTGFAANSGTVAALVGRGDVVLADRKNHASLIDGCRLSRADVQIYPHSDMTQLIAMLGAAAGYRRRLIVTDSLFSMDGDFAPLAELVEIADRHDAMLMIDEAHAVGVFGENGRGVAEQLGIEDRVPIRVGTLSKALGSAGGFVAGSQSLIDWLLNRARSYVFSTADPPAVAGAATAALEIVGEEPWRRTELLSRAALLREEIRRQGWNIGAAASQIIPIYLGEPHLTMRLAAELRRRELFVPGIRPPSVPDGESLLRISLTYGHTPRMLEHLIKTLGELR